MAENEILDIGSSRRYRRFKAALTDVGLSPADVAETLKEEVLTGLRRQLGKEFLYPILQACKQSPAALRDAVGAFKEKDLARLVQNACDITKSTDANVIAGKSADMLIDKLIEQCQLHIEKDKYGFDAARCAELHQEIVTNLEGCRAQIVVELSNSLSGGKPKILRARRQSRPSANTVVSTSLRM